MVFGDHARCRNAQALPRLLQRHLDITRRPSVAKPTLFVSDLLRIRLRRRGVHYRPFRVVDFRSINYAAKRSLILIGPTRRPTPAMNRCLTLIIIICLRLTCYGESEDAVRLFERGVAAVEQKKDQLSKYKMEFVYDVKKTDSLVQPVVGFLTVKIYFPSDGRCHEERRMEFAFTHGQWVLTKFQTWIAFGDHFTPLSPEESSDPVWKMVQECFIPK